MLYDKPAEVFHPITLLEKHDLLIRLAKDYPLFGSEEPNKTAFTFINSDGEVELKPDRPGLLISSTSWTPDEDFSILLRALESK